MAWPGKTLWSLRSHLIVLVLGAVIPVFAFAIWLVFELNAERRGFVERGLRDTAAALAIAVDREVDSSVTTLQALATSDDLRSGDFEAFRRHASTVLQTQNAWLSVAVIDGSASIVATTDPRSTGTSLMPDDREAFVTALTAARPAVSNLVMDHASGRRAVRVAVPVFIAARPRYMLSALVRIETFEALLTAQHVRGDSVVNVVDRAGVIVARSRRAQEFVGKQPPAEYRAQVSAAPQGFGRLPTLDGIDVYAAWHRTDFGWTIGLGVETPVIDAPLHRALLAVVTGGILLTALAAGLAMVFGRRIGRDIGRLARVAAAVDRRETADIPKGRIAEFAAVAHTLNASAIEQRRYAERLRDLHAIDQAILSGGSARAIGTSALRRLRRLLDVPRVALALYDAAARRGEWIAVDTERPTVLPAQTTFPLSVMGDLRQLQNGEHNVIDRRSLGDSLLAHALAEEGVDSYVVVPMLVDGELIGSLNFGVVGGDAIAAEDINVAREVAAQMAVAIKQAQLRDALASRAEELEARVAERTAALSELNTELEAFAYTVSHDLRAPLRGMQGLAQALLEDYAKSLDETGRDYAVRIAAAASQMDRLIQDLLAYSRLTRAALKLEVTSLDAVVHEARAQLTNELAGADVTVDGSLPAVVGHRATLIQVIVNLLSNAAKYVAPGTIPRIRVWAERRHGCVRLWIEDSGIGIATKHHERIFRVFERLHGEEMYSGTGIGLAIVRKAVQRMGGEVGVEAEEGHGSRFWIELPNGLSKGQTVDGAA